jgi:hypothetical protein
VGICLTVFLTLYCSGGGRHRDSGKFSLFVAQCCVACGGVLWKPRGRVRCPEVMGLDITENNLIDFAPDLPRKVKEAEGLLRSRSKGE